MTELRIEIDVREQRLRLLRGRVELHSYPVSTGLAGTGQREGSACTPLGRHHIRLKIGAGCAPASVFVARRASGEIWTPELARRYPQRDWILTRILWLSGDEPGFNRGGECDTLRRFIYIHGTPDTEPMGVPCSHGCIRMRNSDVLTLFERVENGTRVDIHEGAPGDR